MVGSVVLTGATSGIGRAAALVMAGSADHLVLHGIEREKEVEPLLRSVRAALRPGAELSYFDADFTDLGAVAELARAVRALGPVATLVNNAGRPAPPTRMLTDEDNELTFQTNYLAPVVLTRALLETMGHGARGRIINVSSATHLSAYLDPDDLTFEHRGYTPTGAYAHSKLALVIYACWLARHREGRALDVVSMHPGVISTGLLHAMFSIAGDRPEHGGENVAYVAALHDDNGTYYDERIPAAPNRAASDPVTQDALHEATLRILERSEPRAR